MENDAYENEESTNLPIKALNRLAIKQPVDKTQNHNLINGYLNSHLKVDKNLNNLDQNNLLILTKSNSKEFNLIKDKTQANELFISATISSPFLQCSSSSDQTKLNSSYSKSSYSNKCNSSQTIPTTIHQLTNNDDEQQQNSLCNIDCSRVNNCTKTTSSSSSLVQNLEESLDSLESTSNTIPTNISFNKISNFNLTSSKVTSRTGSNSLIKQQPPQQAVVSNSSIETASIVSNSSQLSNPTNLGGTITATTPVSLMTIANNQQSSILSTTFSLQNRTNPTTSSNVQSNNFKSFTNLNCGDQNCALSISQTKNQLIRGQEMVIQDMFISKSQLMCFCQPQQQTTSQNHPLHHYPNQTLNHHQNINHQTNHSSYHHPAHHHFLQNSNIQHLNPPATALNQASPINNTSLVSSNFSNSFNSMVNLNNVINLNNSNNRSYLNGSPVNHQIADSTVLANSMTSNSNISSEDSLASLNSLDQNNSPATVRLNSKSRKRRKKDKRKFKQNLSSSFEKLNTNDNGVSTSTNLNSNLNSNLNNNLLNTNSLTNSPPITAAIDIQSPMNRFHQLNSNLFGQLPNDYFYLNFNQQNGNQSGQQNYSSSINNNNLFKNQNLSNSLRMDKHNKKLISIGHFNNTILGHLNQSTATNQQQCNLIKQQNLLLDTRHYRSLQVAAQQQQQSTGYRSSNANNFCTTLNTPNNNGYELAASTSSSNLCTALLTPPHSPAHLIQSVDTMFTLNNQNCSSSNFTSTNYSNSVNQSNLFNRYHHYSVSAFRPHHLQNFELPTRKPPDRPWITLRQPSKHRPSCIFTVMSYNILCDKLVTRQLYGYCPNWALAWEYRRRAIMEEIRNYNADIISLQEVETEKFYNFFKPEMEKLGYDGIFSPKSRAKTMSENERKHVDGCAIFYRCSKFTLVSEHLMEFNQLAMANAGDSDNMLNRVMTKDNIGLAALLQTKESAFEISGTGNAPLLDRLNLNNSNASSLGKSNSVNGNNSTNGTNSTTTNGLPSATHAQPLLVTTAHMHWDPEYSDVKLIQTMMLIHELRRIAQQVSQNKNYRDICQIPDGSTDPATAIPLVFCADLNSLPTSAVVEFLSSGTIAADHIDFKEIPYKDSLRKLSTTPESTTHYNHPFEISKAYPDDLMPYTNYTADFKGVIDYIFYSKAHMSTLGLLGPLDPEWIKENKIVGCPHPHLPSDHFPLLTEFQLDLQSSGNSTNNQQGQNNQLANGILRR